LTIDANGRLHLEGHGVPLDWLVKMRRLPAERMLDRMVADHVATPADMRNIARRLAAFYRSEAAVHLAPRACRAGFLHEVARNRRELLRAAYGLPAASVRHVCDAHRAFLRSRAQLIEERVRAMRMVEGHGDLRPEHVCIGPGEIWIIDCLEAERRLRIVDPADETAYLALELERYGAPDLAAVLMQAYSKETGDLPAPALVAFYQSFRACVRARLAIRHLDDPRMHGPARWRQRALDYLGLAQRHLPSTSSVSEPPV
jgi:aminoglycoside phosphotransferase family enzyme